jgi:hypothetical protein
MSIGIQGFFYSVARDPKTALHGMIPLEKADEL